MKYITLIIGLLVVGCGKSEVEKLVGDWWRMVFQSDGTMVWEEQNRARSCGKWKIVGKEVHVEDSKFVKISLTRIYKIESNGDLTEIAYIEDGKREEVPNDETPNGSNASVVGFVATYKKIK